MKESEGMKCYFIPSMDRNVFWEGGAFMIEKKNLFFWKMIKNTTNKQVIWELPTKKKKKKKKKNLLTVARNTFRFV